MSMESGQEFIRRAEVQKMCGIRTSTLYEMINKGEFPKPIKLSTRSVAWLKSDVIEWQKSRVAARSNNDMERSGGTDGYARSRVTNGNCLLPGVDGRSVWARRFRDLTEGYSADLGENPTQSQKSLVRRVATIDLELERMETRFAETPASAAEVDIYQRAGNTLLRCLETLGLKRR